MLASTMERYAALANGAAFKRDHVWVTRGEGVTAWPAAGPLGYKLDEPELRAYLEAPDKQAFVAKTQGQMRGSAMVSIYNAVWEMMHDKGPMVTRCYRQTRFSVTFRKR